MRFSAQTSPLRKSTLAAKDEFHALCVIPAGSERGFFTTPRLVIVALRHNTALHAAMLPQRWSNLCAGGHSFRSNAIITASWKASPLRANSRSSRSCTQQLRVEG